jgi:hypothetical protein
VRVLFTVALAVAVAAVAFPAVEAVGVERADTRTGAAAERLVTAARSLAAGNDALPPERGPARDVVELDLPSGGVASASLVSLSVGPPATDGSADRVERSVSGTAATRITWRVAGGSRHVRQVAGLRIRPVSGERWTTGGGRQRLVLRLVRRGGRRVVTVTTGPRRFK